jgi:3-deoxy-D-manno-octulosonic-acid transferase
MILLITSFIFYQITHIFLAPFALIYIAIRKIKRKPVFGNFLERLGFITKADPSKETIWFHAVSVGEVLSIQTIVEKIKKEKPNTTCYLTVGTLTGKKIAKEKLTIDHVSFLPYDFLLPMFMAYKRIKPKKIVVVEAEIWPNLLMIANLKKIPIYLINARMNDKSKNRYNRFKFLLIPIFNLFEKIYTQSNYDKKEFEKFGIKEEKLSVLGNIKASNVLEKQKKFLASKAIKPKPKNINFLVGSLHPGELDVHLNLFKKIKKKYPDLRLTLAPRHFHWRDELIKKVHETGHSFSVWDQENKPDYDKDILLVCKLGELFLLYQQATIFFLGGTFVPIGGHNLLEPAVWGIPTIVGPYFQNCKVVADELIEHNALFAVNETELIKIIEKLLEDRDQLNNMGMNIGLWLKKEAGRVEKEIERFLAGI